MGLNTRFTVGSVILAIMLLSIVGVSRAFRSLTGNEPEERTESSRVDAFTDSDEADDSRRASSQANGQSDAQAPDVRTRNEEGDLEYSPLQTAGTFIQRQQRLEEDPAVLGTDVSVLAVVDDATTDSSPTAAAGNTITSDQSDTPTPIDASSSPNPTSSAAPATTPAAVPALW